MQLRAVINKLAADEQNFLLRLNDQNVLWLFCWNSNLVKILPLDVGYFSLRYKETKWIF